MAFDPAKHMRKIRTRQGMQDYLDVKWRLAWLRDVDPAAKINTAQIEGDHEHARFICVIELSSGAVATGHGSETMQDFPDFYEKAETKAIGRACAVLGFGTDTAFDFEDPEPAPTETATAASSRQVREAGRPGDNAPVPQRRPTPEERLDGHHGAATVPLKGQRPARASTGDDFLDAALPEPKPEQRPATPPKAASVAPRAPEPRAAQGDMSNKYQHAQLDEMSREGLPIAAMMKEKYGHDVPAKLNREEARQLIVEARQRRVRT
jgi:hypothetical protein